MHFNPYFSCMVYTQLCKIWIKMHVLSYCFISVVCFLQFLLQLTKACTFMTGFMETDPNRTLEVMR